MWVHSFKPALADIPHDTKVLADFVKNYSKQKKKSLLIYGPAGTGKTSAVYALAKELGLELIEVNASDDRTANDINTKVGNAIKQYSLFSSGKIVLIDELDGISGQSDRGAIPALLDLIKDSKFPIVCIANDPYESKLNSLKTKSVLLEFPALTQAQMVTTLQKIAARAKVTVSEDVLKSLARRSGGDLRGALLDLETLSLSKQLTLDGVNTLSDREKEESIIQALTKILKSTDPVIARTALDNIGEDVDEAILWIDENMPKEYAKEDLARAYHHLSRADVFRGRIRKWQYWRYLVYVFDHITAGIATAKDKKPTNIVQYTRTQRLLKIWMANNKYAKRKSISQKLGPITHTSLRKTIQHTFPYMHVLYQNKHPSAELLTKELDLEEEQIEWLTK